LMAAELHWDNAYENGAVNGYVEKINRLLDLAGLAHKGPAPEAGTSGKSSGSAAR
jgi:hypothetical protein